MRMKILLGLTVLLGVLIFVNFFVNGSEPVSNQTEKEYITHTYTIVDMDDSGYYGQADQGQKIYIKKENIQLNEELEKNDRIIVYFEKGSRIDGLTKVEKESNNES